MNTARISGRAALATALLALAPSIAHAHTGAGAVTGFAHGFAHPLLGLDHLLAMIAVGILAAQRRGRTLVTLPIAFMGVMLAGFIIGAAGLSMPGVELGIAASVIVLGAAAARRVALPVLATISMVGVFALFHGHAHGAEMPAATGSVTYAVGFAAATAMLILAGAALTFSVRSGLAARTSFDRVLGGAIAVAGVLLLL